MSRKKYYETYENNGKKVKVVPYDGCRSEFEFITLKSVDAITLLEAIKDYEKQGYAKNTEIWRDDKGFYSIEMRVVVEL